MQKSSPQLFKYPWILHGLWFLDLGGQTRVFFCHLQVSDLKPQQSWDICIPVLAPWKLAWATQGRAILCSLCCSSSSGSVPGSIWGKGSCRKHRAQTRQPQNCEHSWVGISWTGSHLLFTSMDFFNLKIMQTQSNWPVQVTSLAYLVMIQCWKVKSEMGWQTGRWLHSKLPSNLLLLLKICV